MVRRNALLLCAIGCTLLLASCADEPKILKYQSVEASTAVFNYPKLSNYFLDLTPGSLEFFAGQKAGLTMVLQNSGGNKVVIEEWYMNDPDNIAISYQRWHPDMGGFEPDESKWISLPVTLKQPVRHFPLELYPLNSVSIEVPLPFIEELAPGEVARFFVRAKLNLTSVDVESKVFSVVAF